MDFALIFREPCVAEFLKMEIEEADCEDLTPDHVISRTELFLSGKISLSSPRKCRISKLGSNKKRIVYIFSDEDRLVLKLLNYVLSRCDLGLGPNCLAFRPGFSAQAAFRRMIAQASASCSCIRVDIRDYFNSIPIAALSEVVQDALAFCPEAASAVISLINDPWVLDNETLVRDDAKGAMAGMPLSPLLANLYLKDFDERASLLAGAYARYSDDVIVFCEPGKAEAILAAMRDMLEVKGLVLNIDKTRISAPGEPWDFVGFSYCDGAIDLSGAAIRKMKGKISRAARRLYRWKVRKNATTERAVRALIRKFDYKFFGSGIDDEELTWSRWYYPTISRIDGLSEIDRYFQQWARYLATGRHTKKNFSEVSYQKMKEWGYVPLVAVFYNRERDPSIARALRAREFREKRERERKNPSAGPG
jgi:hypothetical protein